jgi:hypothetical protein
MNNKEGNNNKSENIVYKYIDLSLDPSKDNYNDTQPLVSDVLKLIKKQAQGTIIDVESELNAYSREDLTKITLFSFFLYSGELAVDAKQKDNSKVVEALASLEEATITGIKNNNIDHYLNFFSED